MTDIKHKINVWIASKPVESQRRIAYLAMFLMAFTFGTVFSYTIDWLFSRLFFSTPPTMTWLWAIAFGIVVGYVAVWNIRYNAVPDGGFRAPKEGELKDG